jgi:hypothetical protein
VLIGAEDLVAIDASQAAVVMHPFAFRRHTVVIEVAGVTGAVHFDCDDAAAHFAARYADLVVHRRAEHHAFVMRDAALGWLFWASNVGHYQWPHGDLPANVVAFLADALALTAFLRARTDGLISLHAAAVGVPGGVAAIIGDSNVGKTTTAVACARAGMDLYSDERCLIDRDGCVHPFPRAINLRAPGLRLLANDTVPGDDPIGGLLRSHGAGTWNDLRLSDLLGAHHAFEPRPLRMVFLLAGTARFPAIATTTAARATGQSARWAQGAGAGLARIARLVELFSRVPCVTLHLGLPDASARLIRETLEARVAQPDARTA